MKFQKEFWSGYRWDSSSWMNWSILSRLICEDDELSYDSYYDTETHTVLISESRSPSPYWSQYTTSSSLIIGLVNTIW